jgi:hypothetical protein
MEIHYERHRLGFDWDEDDSSLVGRGETLHLCSERHSGSCEGWIA